MPLLWAPALILLLAGTVVLLRMLTWQAGLSGAVIAWCLWLGTGFTGIGLLALLFGLGAGATRWARAVRRAPISTKKSLKPDRTASQVWANGGLAGLAGLLAILFPSQQAFFLLLAAAAITSATADTLSSELGTLYGSRFFNIRSLQPDQRGADGAVSWEGSCFGLAGSMLLALFYWIMTKQEIESLIVLLAGNFGNLADSYFGARWQRNGKLNNDQVNGLNTLVAVVTAILLSFVLI